MSREVIGSGATVAGPERVPLPRHDARPAVATDLDAPAAPAPAETQTAPQVPTTRRRVGWPASAPAWLGGPAGVVGAVVVGLLAGALLGVGAAERSAADRRAESIRLLGGLTYPRVGYSGIPDGTMNMDVLVINAGPEPVLVVSVGFGDGVASSLTLSEPYPMQLGPGEALRAAAELRVDCDAPGGGVVVVEAETLDGRSRQVPLDQLDSGDAMLGTEDLAFMCGQFAPVETLQVFSTSSRGDGSLNMTVRNTQSDQVTLTMDGPVGTTIVSEPAFPLELGPNSSEFLILRVRVDECTGAATRPDAGNDLSLLVDNRRDQAYLDPVITAGWLARQVALVCG